jgi:hypothetical protein
MILIANHVQQVISCLNLNVHLARANAQLVLHQMNALNVKKVFTVHCAIKNAPQDARMMFVT